MTPPPAPRRRLGALAVAAGILLSRIAGLIRTRVFAHYLGQSDAAGAFTAALRIPNLLQNLFGEGVLSASFIPVYARLLADSSDEKRTEEERRRAIADAGRVAAAVASLLALLISLLCALGVVTAPYIIDVIAPGFTGDVRDLTIRLVRIMFPGIGLLVLSAWCLGILNSHRRFFLSYVAPVLWNIAMIATLFAFGAPRMSTRAGQMDLAVLLAWAAVAGSALQLLVQVPLALRLARPFRPSLGRGNAQVRAVLASFAPVVVSRGVVQLSAYIDQMLASYLGTTVTAALANAQVLYLLPISLFGMSVSAAELPEMARETGTPAEVAERLRKRLVGALARIAFFVVPSAAAFLVLGDVVAGALFQTGRFGRDDVRVVWIILAGSSVGLVAAAQANLLRSTFYALRDTRTPLLFAVVRVTLTAVAGWAIALPLRARFDLTAAVAAAGLTASAGVAGWLEYLLLRRALTARIGRHGAGALSLLRVWIAATLAVAAAFGAARFLPLARHPVLAGLTLLGGYGALYGALALLFRIPEAQSLAGTLRRRLLRR